MISPTLEDGEIVDDVEEPYSLPGYGDNGVLSHLSASSDMHLVSWTSQDDEREVDRIIAEMQGYSNAGIVNDEEAALWGGDESEDEEEALRRAAIVSAQKNKRQQHLVRRTNSHGDAKKSFYEFGHCSNLTQQTDDLCHPASTAVAGMCRRSGRGKASSKSTWVRLDSRQVTARTGSRRSSKSGVEPLLVTVTNESANEHNVLPTTQDVSESQLASSKEYDEALHNIRMCFEQNATLTTVNREQEGDLGDNYEQVGMDIVDSDLDSQSRSGAPRIMPVEGDMMNGNTVPADEPSLDDEAERLRAALLEQVKRKKHLEERADISMNSREEGEISGGSSPTPSPDVAHKIVTANLSAVVNCDDYSAGLHATTSVPRADTLSMERSCRGRTDTPAISLSKSSRFRKKRSVRQRRSNSSDRETIPLSETSEVPLQKRRSAKRKIRSSARNGDQHIASVDRLQSLERSVEEWESLIEEERKEKELIESKMRHKDVQRSTNASKRDRYLERAYRCCQEIGFLDSELMMLKGDLEKVKGRMSFFERECEKAKKTESRRGAEQKAAERMREREAQKRLCQTHMDGSPLPKTVRDAHRGNAGLVNDVGGGIVGVALRDKRVPSGSYAGKEGKEMVEAGIVGILPEIIHRKEPSEMEGTKGLSRELKGSADQQRVVLEERAEDLELNDDEMSRSSEDIQMDDEDDEEGNNEDSRSPLDENPGDWCLLDSVGQESVNVEHRGMNCPSRFTSNGEQLVSGNGSANEFYLEDLDENVREGSTGNEENGAGVERGAKVGNKEGEKMWTAGMKETGTVSCFEPASSARTIDASVEQLKDNLLLRFAGYRICPTFPYNLIAHRSVSNKLDPMRPLCYYELHGICRDECCIMQHESEYLMSDEEILCSVFVHCPNLCPPDKMFSEYACELLRKRPSKPVGQLICELLNTVPESSRVIKACDMASRYDPEPAVEEEETICYNILPALEGSALHNMSSNSPTPDFEMVCCLRSL